MRYLLIILFTACSIVAHASPALPAYIVELFCDNKISGVGLVVYKNADTAYVLTARHVVIDVADGTVATGINLVTSDNRELPANIAYAPAQKGDDYDMALLRTVWKNAPDMQLCADAKPEPGCDLFFYRPLQKKVLPQDDEPAYFDVWNDLGCRSFTMYTADLQPGDSGNAIYSRKGIVGIVAGGYDKGAWKTRILFIEHIKNTLSAAGIKMLPACK